jgi:hypothetical protein
MRREIFNHCSAWVFALIVPVTGFSQSTLTGRVTDEATGEPVPYANVFFSHTTLGSPTLEDGTFLIKNIPNGKYDLTVSVIGYKRFERAMEFQNSVEKITILLKQDPVGLSEVTVVADQADKKYLSTFEKYFLGNSSNGEQCVILNRDKIHPYFDEKENVLTVHASEPIIIDNKSLGYRIHYILDKFEFNFKASTKSVNGVPRFEELPVTGRRDSISRINRRRKAYLGSLNHFMRSLYSNSTREENFLVNVAQGTDLVENPLNARIYPIALKDHLAGTAVKSFFYSGTLKVEYLGGYEPWEYRHYKGTTHQVSYITFRANSITLFENGYYGNQQSLYFEGYLAWAEALGNMLPLSYYPPVKTESK